MLRLSGQGTSWAGSASIRSVPAILGVIRNQTDAVFWGPQPNTCSPASLVAPIVFPMIDPGRLTGVALAKSSFEDDAAIESAAPIHPSDGTVRATASNVNRAILEYNSRMNDCPMLVKMPGKSVGASSNVTTLPDVTHVTHLQPHSCKGRCWRGHSRACQRGTAAPRKHLKYFARHYGEIVWVCSRRRAFGGQAPGLDHGMQSSDSRIRTSPMLDPLRREGWG